MKDGCKLCAKKGEGCFRHPDEVEQDPFGGRRVGVAERLETYIENLKEGHGRVGACSHAEVSYNTVQKHSKGNDAFAALEISAAHFAIGEVENALHQAAVSGNVTAIIYYLGNRDKAHWQSVNRTEHTGAGGDPIDHSVVTRVVTLPHNNRGPAPEVEAEDTPEQFH